MARSRSHEAAIVALVPAVDRGLAAAMLEAGADAFLAEPVDLDQLGQAIADFVAAKIGNLPISPHGGWLPALLLDAKGRLWVAVWARNPFQFLALYQKMIVKAVSDESVELRSGAFRGVKLSPEAVFMRVWARF